jgi:hypothetical protein
MVWTGQTAARNSGGVVVRLACALVAAGALAFLLPGALSSPAAARADGADPVLEVTPSSVTSASGTVYATVTLRNPGPYALEQVSLSWFVNGGSVEVSASPPAPQIRSVAPGGAIAWNVSAKPSSSAGAATVWFRVDLMRAPAASSSAAASSVGPSTPSASTVPSLSAALVPGVATASLAVTPAALPADVSVTVVSGSLSEQTPMAVAVVVTNTSSQTVSVSVTPHQDDYFTVSPDPTASPGSAASPQSKPTPGGSDSRSLRPNDASAFWFTLRANSSIQPGDRTLLFDVTLQAPDATRVVTVSHTVTLSVFGDAEMSSLLGAPAFFLIPGLVVLIVWKFIGSTVGPLTSKSLPDLTSKEFWVLAIAVSLAFAVAYPWVTAAPGPLRVLTGGSRNYLYARGTMDLFLVWAMAFLLPAVLYGVLRILDALLRYNDLKVRDKPMELLRKLGRANAQNGSYAVTLGGRHGVLVEQKPGDERCWVAPPILVDWLSAADADMQAATRHELTTAGDLKTLHSVLEQAQRDRKVLVRYNKDGSLAAPTAVGTDKITFAGKDLIVKLGPASLPNQPAA